MSVTLPVFLPLPRTRSRPRPNSPTGLRSRSLRMERVTCPARRLSPPHMMFRRIRGSTSGSFSLTRMLFASSGVWRSPSCSAAASRSRPVRRPQSTRNPACQSSGRWHTPVGIFARVSSQLAQAKKCCTHRLAHTEPSLCLDLGAVMRRALLCRLGSVTPGRSCAFSAAKRFCTYRQMVSAADMDTTPAHVDASPSSIPRVRGVLTGKHALDMGDDVVHSAYRLQPNGGHVQ
jgi:hypothetical protein